MRWRTRKASVKIVISKGKLILPNLCQDKVARFYHHTLRRLNFSERTASLGGGASGKLFVTTRSPGTSAIQSKPQLHQAAFFIPMLVYLVEAALFIEFPSHLVVLEHIQLEKISKAPGVVHQRPPDPPATVI